jgi:hydroxyacylglutathione hydrolase
VLVEQIAVNNSLRNYMYLVACPDTLEAIAIDPLDHAQVLARAKQLSWNIRGVINTHEHHDHIGGNEPVIRATGASLYAHYKAVGIIDNVDVALHADDVVQVGTSVRLRALDTPGHTFCHTCLLFEGNAHDQTPALFSGDTLFNAGVGNCHNGGEPSVMYATFSEQLFNLEDTTRIYPGHDYIVNNLLFTLDREPSNTAAQSLLAAMQQWTSEQHFISNLAMEKMVNSFFRLDNKEVIARLAEQFDDIQAETSKQQVFLRLRELRNRW